MSNPWEQETNWSLQADIETLLSNTNKNKTLKEEENTLLSRENHVHCYSTEEQTGCVVEGRTGTVAGGWLNGGHLGTNKRQNDRLYKAPVTSPWSKTHTKKEKLKNSLKTRRQKQI